MSKNYFKKVREEKERLDVQDMDDFIEDMEEDDED